MIKNVLTMLTVSSLSVGSVAHADFIYRSSIDGVKQQAGTATDAGSDNGDSVEESINSRLKSLSFSEPVRKSDSTCSINAIITFTEEDNSEIFRYSISGTSINSQLYNYSSKFVEIEMNSTMVFSGDHTFTIELYGQDDYSKSFAMPYDIDGSFCANDT